MQTPEQRGYRHAFDEDLPTQRPSLGVRWSIYLQICLAWLRAAQHGRNRSSLVLTVAIAFLVALITCTYSIQLAGKCVERHVNESNTMHWQDCNPQKERQLAKANDGASTKTWVSQAASSEMRRIPTPSVLPRPASKQAANSIPVNVRFRRGPVHVDASIRPVVDVEVQLRFEELLAAVPVGYSLDL